jgi:hypothetical protein
MEDKNYQQFEEEEGIGMAAEPLMPPMESVRASGSLKLNALAESFQTDELGRIILTKEMRKAVLQAEEDMKNGKCLSEEGFVKRFSKWL